jgi:hypothetical protein
MYLSSDTSLELQFTENGGALRSLRFAALPSDLDDLIMQETARRAGLFEVLYFRGPSYTSHNYGTLTFEENGRFTWTGYNILVPQIIPAPALEGGVVDMRLFLANSLTDRYNGAFTLRFDTSSALIPGASRAAEVDFMYTLDNQGFRIEYVPGTSKDGIVVARRASSPMVIYFYRSETALVPHPQSETQSGRDGQDRRNLENPGSPDPAAEEEEYPE